MPTYEYLCPACKNIDEEFYPRPEVVPKTLLCRVCGHQAERQIGAGGGVIFRGTGFYATDYKEPKGRVGDE